MECVEVQVFSMRVCRKMDNHSMTIQQQNDAHRPYSYTLVIDPLGTFIIKKNEEMFKSIHIVTGVCFFL